MQKPMDPGSKFSTLNTLGLCPIVEGGKRASERSRGMVEDDVVRKHARLSAFRERPDPTKRLGSTIPLDCSLARSLLSKIGQTPRVLTTLNLLLGTTLALDSGHLRVWTRDIGAKGAEERNRDSVEPRLLPPLFRCWSRPVDVPSAPPPLSSVAVCPAEGDVAGRRRTHSAMMTTISGLKHPVV